MTVDTATPEGETPDPFRNAAAPKSNLGHLYRGPSHTEVPSAAQLGARLRAMREDQGLTIVEAARRAGVDPISLSRFEESGEANAQLLLDLVGALSHSFSFNDVFEVPRFTDVTQLREHARRNRK